MAQFALEIDPAGLETMAERMQAGIKQLAEGTAEESRLRAPVISGMLRDSVGVKTGKRKLLMMVTADAPHAALVHNGTSVGPKHPFKTKANPFVREAAKANFEKLRERTD